MVAAEIAVAGNEKLNERYELMRVLGRGNFGETFEALDLETNGRVAIKRLALSKVGDWRAVDLFEREVRVLRNLDHPSIPKYLDFFTTDEGVNLHLVQDLVEGESLASEVAAGRRYVEAEIRDIAERVLTTLIYLQELNPPVFHRDIKPGNLVRMASSSSSTSAPFAASFEALGAWPVPSPELLGTWHPSSSMATLIAQRTCTASVPRCSICSRTESPLSSRDSD
jgi:serine/threonine protein kinase